MTNHPPNKTPQPEGQPQTTDQPQTEPSPSVEGETGADRGWLDEAEEALDRVTKALSAAWEATRDTRMSALESAKLAAKQLGEAIDRGAETARIRWQQSQAAESPDIDPTSEPPIN